MSDTESTQLVPVEQRAAIAINSEATEKHLKELAIKHKSIVKVLDKAGREQAHRAAMELKNARTAIKGVSEAAREDANRFQRAVIAEANRLIEITQAEEERLFAVRDEWDAEQERIKAEKAAAEKARTDAIKDRIQQFTGRVQAAVSMSSKQIDDVLAEVEAVEIDDTFAEFVPQALEAKAKCVESLTSLRDVAADRENTAALLAQQQAEIERVRAEQAAEAQRLEAIRAQQEAEAAAEKARAQAEAQRIIDEANAKARAEAEERERFNREQADAFAAEKAAAEAAIKAQQEELAAQRKQIEDELNAQREAEARAAKEAADKLAAEAKAKADAEAAEAARKQAEAQALREAEVRERADAIVDAVAAQFQIDHSTAVEYILESAQYLNDAVAA